MQHHWSIVCSKTLVHQPVLTRLLYAVKVITNNSLLIVLISSGAQGDSCTDGSIRLVNGSLNQEGRVEICVNNIWGSVCDSGWDKSDALVICKQLGMSVSG